MKKKKFSKLREWNRRRNYMMKDFRKYLGRLIFDRKTPTVLPLAKVKSVLILRNDDKVGDMVVTTSLIREFSRNGYIVDVLAGENNVSVIDYNPWVNQIFVEEKTKPFKKQQARQLRHNSYDLVVDTGEKISIAHLILLKKLNAKNIMGFNKSKYKIFNQSLDYYLYDQHITSRYQLLMRTLGLKNISTDYDLHCAPEIKKAVAAFIAILPGRKRIVINPWAADQRRDMSFSQLTALVTSIKTQLPETDIIFVGTPSRMKELTIPDIYINPVSGLAGSIEMIRLADVVITPDTSVVHIAATWKKPMVCLYGQDVHGGFINNLMWGPGYSGAIQLKTKNRHQPLSAIEADEIFAAVKQFF